MEKLTRSLLTSSVLTLLIMNTSSQAASAGTLTFNGELTQNTCDVSVNGQGPDGIIVLPTVLTSALRSAGQTAGQTRFGIAIKNCEGSLASVGTFFEAGPTVNTLTGRLKNTDSTGADNVTLQLINQFGGNTNPIQVGSPNQIKDSPYAKIFGTTGLVYAVQYYAEGLTTPGLVKSNVVYSLMYK